MSEKLDVYNYKRIKTGKIIERNENAILDKCDYILAIQCWIINAKCEILLTRRKLDKVHGGMWEPTGGLVQSGENSIQATKRELNEEIGINISDRELKFIKEKIESMNVKINYFNIEKDKQILFNYIKDKKLSFVHCAASVEFSRQIMNILNSVDKNIKLSISNNNLICCGEGICGACIVDLNGKKVKTCKAQIDSREYLTHIK